MSHDVETRALAAAAPPAPTVEHVRWRTYLEHDETGWWCTCSYWYERFGPVGPVGEDPIREPDDGMRVGRFPSRQVARKELRGDFRKCITEATQRFLATIPGAKIVAAAFGEEPAAEH